MSDAYLVRRGGAGVLSPNSAVIHVTAPAGSTISFEKGGVVAKVLGPGKQHINISDSSFAEWYYAVAPHHFGSWTVTGTNSEGSISQTITVNDVKQYDVTLFSGHLYWQGDECIGITGGWEPAEAYYSNGYYYRQLSTIAKDPDLIRVTAADYNGSEGCLGTVNKVDLTRYNSLNINLTVVNTSSYAKPRIIVSSSNVGQVSAAAARQLTARGASSLDISSLSGKYYILLCLGYIYNEGCSMRFDKVWLET